MLLRRLSKTLHTPPIIESSTLQQQQQQPGDLSSSEVQQQPQSNGEGHSHHGHHIHLHHHHQHIEPAVVDPAAAVRVLLEAEHEAELIVKAARSVRSEMLKHAKEEALTETSTMKNEFEQHLEEIRQQCGNEVEAARIQTAKRVKETQAAIRTTVADNGPKVARFLVECVVGEECIDADSLDQVHHDYNPTMTSRRRSSTYEDLFGVAATAVTRRDDAVVESSNAKEDVEAPPSQNADVPTTSQLGTAYQQQPGDEP
ncbi:hypothetical protein Pelo_11273 [Pelomyxa schiedti]|nr:hypothetical protein Pelo_11273 [Pelomyxa schiedti]